MHHTITITNNVFISKVFNSKEQASEYAKCNEHKRYKPHAIADGKFILKSLFFPICYVAM